MQHARGHSSSGRTVRDLCINEWGFVAPSALLVTRAGRPSIQADAAAQDSQDTGASMFVLRAADGYVVDVTHCSYQWHTSDDMEGHDTVSVMRVIFGDVILKDLRRSRPNDLQ